MTFRRQSRRPLRDVRRRLDAPIERLEDRSVPTTIGAFDNATATWYLRDANGAGPANAGQFQFGAPGWKGVSGDWNSDTRDTIGVVDPTKPAGLTWYLSNVNAAGPPAVGPFAFGAQSWVPLAGDWDGNGSDTVGAFDPLTATFYLRNQNSAGPANVAFSFGAPGWTPVVGDWDGSGTTTIGVVDPFSGTWYLRNSNGAGPVSYPTFRFGSPGWQPVTGDWDGNGTTGIGVVTPNEVWVLKNTPSEGTPDYPVFAFGAPGWQPVTGDWTPMPMPVDLGGGIGSSLFADAQTSTTRRTDRSGNDIATAIDDIPGAIDDVLPAPPMPI